MPTSKFLFYVFLIMSLIDVIFLNGLYVESYFMKGLKGFKLFHDCDYFKERMYFHKDVKNADKWTEAVREQSDYIDVTKKYEKMHTLGKGKFSTVYLCRSQETEDLVAMKVIDKK